MIDSVVFKNFKALRDTTLPLGRFTLIIGPNGSGKSTAINALKAAANPGIVQFPHIVTASERQSGSIAEIVVNFSIDERKASKKVKWQSNGFSDITYNPPEEVKNIDQVLNNLRVYAFLGQSIVRPTQLDPTAQLFEDGTHLAIVLDRLRDEHPERFEAINEALGRWLPEFDRILFNTPQTGLRTFSLRTREGKHSISADDLSQGTLLAFALLTVAYLPDPPTVVCLEEPDRGIHPRLLRDVQDALYRLSYPEGIDDSREPVQVIATTHSPYLLDLYRNHPEEVVIAHKTGLEAQFERLTDQQYFEQILEDSHLGEAWYTGILGGVPNRL